MKYIFQNKFIRSYTERLQFLKTQGQDVGCILSQFVFSIPVYDLAVVFNSKHSPDKKGEV